MKTVASLNACFPSTAKQAAFVRSHISCAGSVYLARRSLLSPQRDFLRASRSVWRGCLRWISAIFCSRGSRRNYFHFASYCNAHCQPLICVCSHTACRTCSHIPSFKERCCSTKIKIKCLKKSCVYFFIWRILKHQRVRSFFQLYMCFLFCNLLARECEEFPIATGVSNIVEIELLCSKVN